MILAGELPELIEKCRSALASAGYSVDGTGGHKEILKFIVILDALKVIEFRRHSPPVEG
jgi:hypothetical protein